MRLLLIAILSFYGHSNTHLVKQQRIQHVTATRLVTGCLMFCHITVQSQTVSIDFLIFILNLTYLFLTFKCLLGLGPQTQYLCDWLSIVRPTRYSRLSNLSLVPANAKCIGCDTTRFTGLNLPLFSYGTSYVSEHTDINSLAAFNVSKILKNCLETDHLISLFRP